jgi:hypothetical protein
MAVPLTICGESGGAGQNPSNDFANLFEQILGERRAEARAEEEQAHVAMRLSGDVHVVW